MNWYKIAKKSESMYKIASFFSIPYSAYKDIVEHTYQAYQQISQKNLKRLTKESFPPKIFKLDFSNTQYEFLNTLNPEITLQFTMQREESWFDRTSPTTGIIQLSLNDNVMDVLSWIIEHEVLHFIQELIRTHVRQKYDIPRKQKADYGGLPPQNAIQQGVSAEGFLDHPKKYSQPSKQKKVRHTKRPIEHYTDLNTIIRILQRIHYTIKNEISKKELYTAFINNQLGNLFKNNNITQLDVSSSIATSILAEAKKNPPLYKIYLQHIWKGFVESDYNVDFERMDEMKSEINNTYNEQAKINKEKAEMMKQADKPIITNKMYEERLNTQPYRLPESSDEQYAEKKSQYQQSIKEKVNPYVMESDFNNLTSFVIGIDDIYYFSRPKNISEEESENNSDEIADISSNFTYDLIEKLPYVKHSDDQYGYEGYRFPANFKKVMKLLNTIKTLKSQNPEAQQHYDSFALDYIEELNSSLEGTSFDIQEFYNKYYLN